MVSNFLKFAYEHGWIVSSLEGLIAKDYIVGHLDGNHGNLYPRQEEFTDSGVKYISANAITGGQIDFSKAKFLSNERANKFKKGVAVNGDVIFAHNATVGPVAVLETTDEKVILSTSLTYYRTNKEKIDARYLSQFMSSSAFTRQYESIMRQTTRNQIPITTQREFLFAIPPLSEQKKIAQILSTWDKAITTTEQLLANSQQQKKALMQQLLTGKKRLLDKNGVRFSGEWSKVAIGKIIKEIKKEKELNPNSIELLTVKLHYKGVTRSGKFPNATERGRPYFRRYKGELIIGRQNLHNGGIAIVSDECNGLIASNAISSFEARKGVDINFILFLMSTEHFRFTVDNLAGGTGQKETGVKDLLSWSQIIPDFEEQQKIAAVLSTADQEITTLQQKLDALKQEKKALMQQLLTGKRRVKIDDKEVA